MENEKEKRQRTIAQNNALHLWCTQLADKFREAGYTRKIQLGTMLHPWTMESVKLAFKEFSVAMYGKEHTSDLTTDELTHVAEVFDQQILEQLGIDVPFPSFEEKQYQTGQIDEHGEVSKRKKV